jgi:hypothetical protein
MKMKSFSCVGSGGVSYCFEYEEEHLVGLDCDTWIYRVWGSDSKINFFEFVLKEIDIDTLRIVVINNHHVPELTNKGIAGGLIKLSRRNLGRVIESSPKAGREIATYRTKDAEKVWERLVLEGVAYYDQVRDVYIMR